MEEKRNPLKKLGKLLRDPTQFLLDSPNIHLADSLLRARAARLDGGGEGELAYAWGFSEWKQDSVRKAFPEFQLRFFRHRQTLLHAIQVLADSQGLLVVWGYSAPPALVHLARLRGIPVYRMEDGFVRSVGLGASHALARSLALDTSGRLYFDATGPTQLEKYCNEHDFEADAALLDEARRCMALIREQRISKYNNVQASVDVDDPFAAVFPRAESRRRVLVIGQVEDDASIRLGRASVRSNLEAVRQARSDHPTADIIFKPHPDYLAGHTRRRDLRADMRAIEKIAHVPSTPLPLHRCFDWVDQVVTITSLSGFEALLCGLPVTTLGLPFYAGWGLTDDRVRCSRRGRKLTLEQLFAAAYLLYPRYFDPFTGRPTTLETTISELAKERDRFRGTTALLGGFVGFRPRALVFGVEREQQCHLQEMLAEYELFFAEDAHGASLQRNTATQIRRLRFEEPSAIIMVWGSREPQGLVELSRRLGMRVYRLNDGPVRGLGAPGELDAQGRPTLPLSLTIDSKALPYDSSQQTEIEDILNDFPFDKAPDLLARAQACRQRLRLERISKYNVTHSPSLEEVAGPETRRRVLVIGDRDGSSSQRLSTGYAITNNDVVLAAVREHPDAEVLFKPHPASTFGSNQALTPAAVSQVCTVLPPDIGLPEVLPHVDHVYTISSFGGLEGILHGLPVTCFGANFYAGWGLTDDRVETPRRRRTLTVDELFAGYYLVYSRYYDPISHQRIELEDALELFKLLRLEQAGVEDARVAEHTESNAERLDLLGRAIAKNPHVARWRALQAQTLRDDGQLDAAVTAYQDLVSHFPRSLPWRLDLLELRVERNDAVSVCQEEYRQLLSLQPEPGEAHISYLSFLRRHGLPWMDQLSRALAAAPSCAPARRVAVADALLEAGDQTQAHTLLDGVPTAEIARYLRVAGQQGPRQLKTHSELLRQLSRAVRRNFDWRTLLGSGFELVASVDACELPELSRSVVLGGEALPGRPLVHVMSAPTESTARHVVLLESALLQPHSNWIGLASSLKAGAQLHVVPWATEVALTKQLGCRPSLRIVVSQFLRDQGLPA